LPRIPASRWIGAKGKVKLSVSPVCWVELKGTTGSRRLYLYDLFLKPYWGKPDVRNFREGTGNVGDGETRIPLHNRKGAGRKLFTLDRARLSSTRLGNKKRMDKFNIHNCKYQGPGARVEYSRDYLHGKFTWQLVITKEAKEIDLEENHYLENIGDELWSTVIEVNNCPFCGLRLRDKKLCEIDFAHFDSSGWSIESN